MCPSFVTALRFLVTQPTAVFLPHKMLLALFFVSYYPPILYGQRSAAPSTMEDGSSLDSRRRRSYIKVFPLLMIRRFSSFVADLAVDTGATQHGPLQASPSLLTISVRPAATPGPQLYNTVLYYPTALSYLRLAIRLVGRITDCIFFFFFQNKKRQFREKKEGAEMESRYCASFGAENDAPAETTGKVFFCLFFFFLVWRFYCFSLATVGLLTIPTRLLRHLYPVL